MASELFSTANQWVQAVAEEHNKLLLDNDLQDLQKDLKKIIKDGYFIKKQFQESDKIEEAVHIQLEMSYLMIQYNKNISNKLQGFDKLIIEENELEELTKYFQMNEDEFLWQIDEVLSVADSDSSIEFAILPQKRWIQGPPQEKLIANAKNFQKIMKKNLPSYMDLTKDVKQMIEEQTRDYDSDTEQQANDVRNKFLILLSNYQPNFDEQKGHLEEFFYNEQQRSTQKRLNTGLVNKFEEYLARKLQGYNGHSNKNERDLKSTKNLKRPPSPINSAENLQDSSTLAHNVAGGESIQKKVKGNEDAQQMNSLQHTTVLKVKRDIDSLYSFQIKLVRQPGDARDRSTGVTGSNQQQNQQFKNMAQAQTLPLQRQSSTHTQPVTQQQLQETDTLNSLDDDKSSLSLSSAQSWKDLLSQTPVTAPSQQPPKQLNSADKNIQKTDTVEKKSSVYKCIDCDMMFPQLIELRKHHNHCDK